MIVTDKPPQIPVNLSPIARRQELIKKQKEKNRPKEYGKRAKKSFAAFYQANVP